MSLVLRTARNGRGAGIIEFAFVLPILLLLVLSIFDFGLYFFAQHTLQFATREGARLALVGRVLNDEDGNPLSREASIVKTVRDCAALAINPGRLQISVYPVEPDYSDPADWQNTQNAGLPGAYMRVTTRYDYPFLTPLLASMVPGGHIVVQAQATYRNEAFD